MFQFGPVWIWKQPKKYFSFFSNTRFSNTSWKDFLWYIPTNFNYGRLAVYESNSVFRFPIYPIHYSLFLTENYHFVFAVLPKSDKLWCHFPKDSLFSKLVPYDGRESNQIYLSLILFTLLLDSDTFERAGEKSIETRNSIIPEKPLNHSIPGKFNSLFEQKKFEITKT